MTWVVEQAANRVRIRSDPLVTQVLQARRQSVLQFLGLPA